jgi:hypothetical protein
MAGQLYVKCVVDFVVNVCPTLHLLYQPSCGWIGENMYDAAYE